MLTIINLEVQIPKNILYITQDIDQIETHKLLPVEAMAEYLLQTILSP